MTEQIFECTEVIARVYEFIDGEADPQTCAAIRAHLELCEPCVDTIGEGQSMKALVARACGFESAPEELRQRVSVTITSVTIEEQE
jgi:mycothiol system anti-sigma-R factor